MTLGINYGTIDRSPHWLGLQRNTSDSQWYWRDTGQLASWTNWKSGYPLGIGDCAIGDRDDSEVGWQDVNCSSFPPSGGMALCYTITPGESQCHKSDKNNN